MDNKYMEEALIEARKSFELDEVPIGAVIVYDNNIIARAHNLKEHNKSATAHAEILAIEEACNRVGDWRLNECTLYVTVEPCLMCCGAILQSRIKRTVYAVSNAKFGYVESIGQILNDERNNHFVVVDKIENKEAAELLQSFFQKKRKSPLNSDTKSV